MKKHILFWLLFTGIAVATQAQDMARVKANLDSLTAPRMYGRGYVNYGDRHAAAFLKKQFGQIGLKPFNDTYFQFFTLNVNTFPDRMALQAGNRLLEPGKDFIAVPASAQGEGKAKVVYLDTLAVTQFGNDFNFKAGFRNKAIVFTSPKARKMALSNPALSSALPSAAVVITLQKKLTASLAPEQLPYVALEVLETSWPEKTKKVRYAVDAELLQNHISQNVIGYLPGTVYPDSFIVVTAHYDHLGQMGRDAYFAGANDNASGVSMLLELAHYYSKPGNTPAYSMLFIGFSAEEAGLIGSKFYTEHPLVPLEQTKFLINLDLMGTGSEGMMVVNGKVFEEEFAMLEKLNQEHQFLPALKRRGEAANSDHYHFTKNGVRGFFFYTLGGTTAYHDVFDTADQLPLTGYKGVFGLITRFIAALEKK